MEICGAVVARNGVRFRMEMCRAVVVRNGGCKVPNGDMLCKM